MSRNLKALGLALIAALAMSAFAAASSNAALKATCAEYPCVITGHQIEHNGSSLHLFKTDTKQEVTCKKATFDATVTEAGRESITVTPTYDECEAKGGPVTVTLNGCHYTIYGGEETSTHHFVNGTTDIICPKEKLIEVHIFSNASSHTAGTSACTITIGPQTKLLGQTATNDTGATDDVTLTTEVTNIAVKGHGLLCAAAKTAEYTGGTTLQAYKDAGTHAGPPVVYTEGTPIGLTVSK